MVAGQIALIIQRVGNLFWQLFLRKMAVEARKTA
jgi:hypothetical protein